MIRTVALTLAALTLTACSASVSGGPSSPGSSPASTSSSVTAKKPSADELNAKACDAANSYIVAHVKVTFRAFVRNLYDQRAAGQLRNETTKLYRISAPATGATQAAIQHIAAGLTNFSIAVQTHDSQGVGRAANRANAAIAEFRGICNV